jgi:hypothetical protein
VLKYSIAFFGVLLGLIFFTSCVSPTTQPLPVLSDKFHDIQSRLLTPGCAYSGCHDGQHPPYLSLQSNVCYDNLLHAKIQNSVADTIYKALVVPGKPDSSFLYIKITDPGAGEGDRMPQRLNKLQQNELDAVRSWIARGAPND